jgi:hypothetical protein
MGSYSGRQAILYLPGFVDDGGQIWFSSGSLPRFFLHVRVLRHRERKQLKVLHYMRIHRYDNLLIPSSSSLRNNWPGVVPHQTLRKLEMYAGQNGMSGRKNPSLMVVNVCNFWPVTSSLLSAYVSAIAGSRTIIAFWSPFLLPIGSLVRVFRSRPRTVVPEGPRTWRQYSQAQLRKVAATAMERPAGCGDLAPPHEQPGAAAQPQPAREEKKTLQSPKNNLFSERV